jgi:transposase
MSYPLKFRKKVMEVKKKDKLTFEETSKRFHIGIASLFRWQKRIEPCLTRNKPATKVDMKKLAKDIEDKPDAYQYERAKRLKVCQRAIGYAMQRLKISYKKNLVSS